MADPPETIDSPPPLGVPPTAIPPTDPVGYRDLAAKGRLEPLDVMDVRRFGASGDGGHDDVAALLRAVDAVPSKGGVIYLPRGDYRISAEVGIDKPNVHVVGQGREATKLTTTAATINGLNFGSNAAFCSVSGISVLTSVAKSSGAGVRAYGCSNVALSDFFIKGHYRGIDRSGSLMYITRGYILNSVNMSIGLFGGNDVYISDVVADAPSGSQPNAGLYITAVAGVWVRASNFLHQGNAIRANPGASEETLWLHFDGVACDHNNGYGIYLNPVSGGKVRGASFIGCYTSDCDHGVMIDADGSSLVDGVQLLGHRAFLNQKHGIRVEAPAENVSIDYGLVAGSSASVNNNYDGILIANGVDEFAIRNCRSGAAAGFGAIQRYGINIIGTSNDDYIVLGNDVRLNATGGLNDGGTGGNKIVQHNLS